jgi:hypothetical protein
MKILLLSAALLISSLVLFSCKKNPVSPDDNVQPGRRDYVWTVDTLDAPYDTYYRMWGSSPTDVWCVSSGDWEKSIAHFDGNKWTLFGVPGLIVPYSIYGFSSDNIFIGAENGKIWQFDGSSWNLSAQLIKDEHNDIVFENMWGDSPDNLFAFGAYPDSNGLFNNSVIVNYKNNNWTMLNTDELNGIVANLFKNKTDEKIYSQVIKFSNTYDTTFIYSYSQDKYTKLFSSIWDSYWENISLINNEVYFVLRTEIARRVNNKFQTVFKLDNTNFYHYIWGRNSKDIFIEMKDGLAHYNGSDIEYLFNFFIPRTHIYGAVLFENEVFFLVSEPGLNLIYRGKLNE